MDQNKVGLALGAFFGLWHLVWSVIVALGFGQGLLDWIFWLHFLNHPYTVSGFDVVRAAMLIVVTAIVGYVVGWVFAGVWNWAAKKK